MDAGEMYLLSAAYKHNQAQNARTEMVCAHIAQGYSIAQAEQIVDAYLVANAPVPSALANLIFCLFLWGVGLYALSFLIWLAWGPLFG